MKVMVTGHLGYIGPVMIRKLKEAGHHVTGLDVGYFIDCASELDQKEIPDKEILCDIRDVTQSVFEGIDAIIMLAALSNDPMGQLNPELTDEINFSGNLKCAQLAKSAGVRRLIFASSCSIYGAAGNSKPLDETAEFAPVSAYAVSKVKMEQALSEMADDAFSPVFMRNSTAYGVSPRMRLDLVLNNLMGWAHTQGVIKVLSDGTPWRPIVHIEDISKAAISAMEAPRNAVHNQAFNVGRNDSNYQVSEIAEAVHKIAPSANLEITGEAGGDPRSYRVDFSKISKVLTSFQPNWTLEKGVAELDEWFKEMQIDLKTMNSKKYVRLKQLQFLIDTGKIDEKLMFQG